MKTMPQALSNGGGDIKKHNVPILGLSSHGHSVISLLAASIFTSKEFPKYAQHRYTRNMSRRKRYLSHGPTTTVTFVSRYLKFYSCCWFLTNLSLKLLQFATSDIIGHMTRGFVVCFSICGQYERPSVSYSFFTVTGSWPWLLGSCEVICHVTTGVSYRWSVWTVRLSRMVVKIHRVSKKLPVLFFE